MDLTNDFHPLGNHVIAKECDQEKSTEAFMAVEDDSETLLAEVTSYATVNFPIGDSRDYGQVELAAGTKILVNANNVVRVGDKIIVHANDIYAYQK